MHAEVRGQFKYNTMLKDKINFGVIILQCNAL